MALNFTHDHSRRSWIAVSADSDFPIQNLPLGRFRRPGGDTALGMAIGDQVFDLSVAAALDLLPDDLRMAAGSDDLVHLMRLGNPAASTLRACVFDLLVEGGSDAARQHADQLLVAQDAVSMLLPTTPRQFSDMCVSTFHIGRRNGDDARGEPICPPVFRHLPVGYDGRASSVVVSGTDVVRPNGQWLENLIDGDVCFGPEPRLDYELELGVWFGGPGNALGTPMSLAEARDAMFGLVLLNDWSARGIQLWETMLGPFLGKSLSTTVSPWVVTAEALAPFATGAFVRPEGDPPVPRHLHSASDQSDGGFDIGLEAHLVTDRTQGGGGEICRTNFRHMYWTFAQMIAHHASNGCAMAAGDLIGSGTCSGPQMSEAACLIEANMNGPLTLPSGETRMWIEDGDTIVLTGKAAREGFATIGFGEARGTVVPAPQWNYDSP